MRVRCIAAAIVLAGLMFAGGCDRGDGQAASAEADEPYYRQGQQLVKQGRSQEALAAYLKVIARRGESAPESHLEAGLIYLQQIKDPLAAIYHFRKYLELQPNSRQAVYVRGLVDTAKREFARTLPAQPLESQSERLEMLDQIDRLQRENEQLKAELVTLRGGVPNPTTRTRASLDEDTPPAATPDRSRPFFAMPTPANQAPAGGAEDRSESPVTLASEPPTVREDSGPVVERAPFPTPSRPGATAASAGPPRPVMTGPRQTPGATPAARASVPVRPTSPVVAGGHRHVVVKGDTLFSLSQRYYGTRARWRDIYSANRDQLPAESSLRIGMELRIP